MKIYTKMLLAAISAATVVSVSAQIEVRPAGYADDKTALDLRNERGRVPVAFDIEIGERFIRRDQRCVITPMFVNGAFAGEFPPVILEGKTYAMLERGREEFDGAPAPECAERIVYDGRPQTVHYRLAAEYLPEYKGATLVLDYRTYDVCGREVARRSSCLAHGVADYSEFIQKNPVVYYLPGAVAKSYVNDFRNRSVFRQGERVIDFEAFRSNGYDDLADEIARVARDAGCEIHAVNILTSASPEGPLEANARLAEDRSEVIARQLCGDLDIDDSLVVRKWTDENWDAFMEELPASGLDNVAAIRAIVAAHDDLDERERELKKLPGYDEIYGIFQNLRNCVITVEYSMRERFPAEVSAGGRACVAIVPGEGEPRIPLEESRRRYDEEPGDVAANNMMVALMERGEWAEALKYAESIPNIGIDPVIANNKAVLYMFLDERYMSATLFELAGGILMSDYNEGLMLLVNGEYEDAAKLLGGYPDSVNPVVANLCAGEYDTAAKLTHLAGPSAPMLYLRAVAYARMDEERLALRALESAVGLDVACKAKALNQAEFIPYRASGQFIRITK